MKNILTYIGILSFAAFFNACSPVEDRLDIDGLVTKTGNEISIIQTSNYKNQVICKVSDNAVGLWEVYRYPNMKKLMTGNLRVDTFILPFQSSYFIRGHAFLHGGEILDSTIVTTTEADPKFFSNPYWKLLSNDAAGRYWQISAKYVGPESNYHSNWWQPDISTETWAKDSVYFDLNFAFTFKHFSKGAVTGTSFSLTTDNFSTAPTILSFGSTSVSMPNNDAGEMAPANANRFRIFRCTADSLVIGQGASLTASRTSEDWAWFWVFLRK